MSENDKPIEENNLPGQEEGHASRQIKFEYTQSNLFRVVHVDGAIGSLTPKLDIHLAFWSERFPIPLQSTYELTPEGNLGREVDKLILDAIVREVEVSMIINVDAARELINLLEDRIMQIEQIEDEQDIEG